MKDWISNPEKDIQQCNSLWEERAIWTEIETSQKTQNVKILKFLKDHTSWAIKLSKLVLKAVQYQLSSLCGRAGNFIKEILKVLIKNESFLVGGVGLKTPYCETNNAI